MTRQRTGVKVVRVLSCRATRGHVELLGRRKRFSNSVSSVYVIWRTRVAPLAELRGSGMKLCMPVSLVGEGIASRLTARKASIS